MNGLKTMALMVTLTLLLVFVGAALGGKNGMTIALIFAFGMNFITRFPAAVFKNSSAPIHLLRKGSQDLKL